MKWLIFCLLLCLPITNVQAKSESVRLSKWYFRKANVRVAFKLKKAAKVRISWEMKDTNKKANASLYGIDAKAYPLKGHYYKNYYGKHVYRAYVYLKAGSYGLKFKHHKGEGKTIAYKIRPFYVYESFKGYDNSPSHANKLVFGRRYYGMLGANDNTDLYRFTLKKKTRIKLDYSFKTKSIYYITIDHMDRTILFEPQKDDTPYHTFPKGHYLIEIVLQHGRRTYGGATYHFTLSKA
jgi:hypothetical protein